MEENALIKTARSIKSESTVAALVILSICIFAYLFYTYIFSKPQPQPNNIPYQENIFPGITTKKQVESNLGKPQESETQNNNETYIYPTINKYRQDKVEFSNEIVSIVKQEVVEKEKGSLNDYLANYGTEEAILYGHESLSIPGYFWGSKGFMIFGSKYDGGINEIWYFAPVTKDEFLANNPNLSEEEKTHTEQFIQP